MEAATIRDALQAALGAQYVVERELGRGATATVYLARDVRHRRAVAVKVLLSELSAALGAERFLREIELTASLQHPHILPLFDSGAAAGMLYYVMPYVQGESLRARLDREGALPIAGAVRLLRELADALEYAHGQGVVHRDLKPENVLLSGGHAVIADFGIAKALAAATLDRRPGAASNATGVGVAVGTPAYMAPEQATGDPDVDHRADLYALGVVAYELLAGAPPFNDRSPQTLIAAHLTRTPEPLTTQRPDVPPALADLVMQLLAKDPVARPPSADAVLRALDTVQFSLAPVTTGSRRRTVVVAAMGGVLLAAAVGGYTALRRAGALGDDRAAQATREGTDAAQHAVAIRTVAVLPFANTAGDVEDEYFSDGLTDELAHALSRLPRLRLAGRTSSYAFKGKAAAAQEIGKALGVSGLIEGTVRRAGERLRITAQLMSTDDGKVLWSGSYESGVRDVFRVQDSVTRAIVSALAPALRGEAAQMAAEISRGTRDSVAYDLYLRGRYFWAQRGAANLHRALDYFQRSITRDPLFARAHAGLGLVYTVLPGYGSESTDSMSALAIASGERALALDSTSADAHLVIGQALGERLELRDAETHFQAALNLDPANATARHWHCLNLNGLGDLDSALAESRRATSLDPLSSVIASAEIITLVGMRRFPDAILRGRQALELDSTSVPLHAHLGLAYLFGGTPAAAVEEFETARRLAPDAAWVRGFLLLGYAAAGQKAAADRVRIEIDQRGPSVSPIDAYVSALVRADQAAALAAVERGLRPGGAFIDAIFSPSCHPLLDPIRSERRFLALLRRQGIPVCRTAVTPRWTAP